MIDHDQELSKIFTKGNYEVEVKVGVKIDVEVDDGDDGSDVI